MNSLKSGFGVLLAATLLSTAASSAPDKKPAPAVRTRFELTPEQARQRQAFTDEEKADHKILDDQIQSDRAALRRKEADEDKAFKVTLRGKPAAERRMLEQDFINRRLAARRDSDQKEKEKFQEYRRKRKDKEAAYKLIEPRPSFTVEHPAAKKR